MVVCHCRAVNDRSINELLDRGRSTIDEIARHCGAGTDCGACVGTIEELLDSAARTSTTGA